MKNTFLINFIGHFLLLLRKVNFFTTNKKQHPFGTLRKFYQMPSLIDKYQIFAIFYDEIVVTWPSSLNELQIFVASSSQTNNELKTILCFFCVQRHEICLYWMSQEQSNRVSNKYDVMPCSEWKLQVKNWVPFCFLWRC